MHHMILNIKLHNIKNQCYIRGGITHHMILNIQLHNIQLHNNYITMLHSQP